MAHQVLQVHQVEVVHQDQQVQLVLRQAAAEVAQLRLSLLHLVISIVQQGELNLLQAMDRNHLLAMELKVMSHSEELEDLLQSVMMQLISAW
jgi:hydroxymethylglutaryl-CoA reductase